MTQSSLIFPFVVVISIGLKFHRKDRNDPFYLPYISIRVLYCISNNKCYLMSCLKILLWCLSCMIGNKYYLIIFCKQILSPNSLHWKKRLSRLNSITSITSKAVRSFVTKIGRLEKTYLLIFFLIFESLTNLRHDSRYIIQNPTKNFSISTRMYMNTIKIWKPCKVVEEIYF